MVLYSDHGLAGAAWENHTMNVANLKNLGHFTGTENYYRHGALKLTDGVKFLADNGDCYWLLDVINSYQSQAKRDPALRYMQFWTLNVEDGAGNVICERDSGDVAIRQRIPYTDFPLSSVKLYVAGDVVMLPSEY